MILRNVDAPKLVVDNIKNQQVSLWVEGDGLIQQASVRTDAFLADNTPAGHGIGEIELNGENGLELKLQGNIKNVVNRTPESALSISSGRVDTITWMRRQWTAHWRSLPARRQIMSIWMWGPQSPGTETSEIWW